MAETMGNHTNLCSRISFGTMSMYAEAYYATETMPPPGILINAEEQCFLLTWLGIRYRLPNPPSHHVLSLTSRCRRPMIERIHHMLHLHHMQDLNWSIKP